MERAKINGIEIEYVVRGSGEPVVLIHGGLLADENEPIAQEPTLTDSYKIINYHRRGFSGSTHPQPKVAVSLQSQASDCLALMRYLGVDRAHVVGHSLGGAIGIQLALDAPEAVHSLAVMEPAIMGAIAKAEAANNPNAASNQEAFRAGMRKVQAVYETGDRRAALVAFLDTRAGEFVRDVMDFLTKTGEFDQAVNDADTFIEVEMPAAFAWQFTPQDAARIKVPVLSILGAHSSDRAQQVHEALKRWVPQTETVILPDADHALPLMDPGGIAKVVRDFIARYPMKVAA
jgi:pimeloyl-ACP methyl ester carboxylesterase